MDFFTKRRGRGRGRRGFTLIELMITVAVLAVLAVIALPSYFGQVRKSRRADAITALNQVVQAQERWRANNPAYSGDLSAAGLNVAAPSSGFYALSASSPGTHPAAAVAGSAYTARATVAGAQASDTRCGVLEVRMNTGTLSYVSVPVGGNITAATTDANRCWNR